jgi:hypothetical protein
MRRSPSIVPDPDESWPLPVQGLDDGACTKLEIPGRPTKTESNVEPEVSLIRCPKVLSLFRVSDVRH